MGPDRWIRFVGRGRYRRLGCARKTNHSLRDGIWKRRADLRTVVRFDGGGVPAWRLYLDKRWFCRRGCDLFDCELGTGPLRGEKSEEIGRTATFGKGSARQWSGNRDR